LLINKAIIDANTNPEYSTVFKEIKAAIFLGTPHRGADIASILNGILEISFSWSSFVRQLQPRSDTITSINNHFIHLASSLSLVSYFETQNTRIIKVFKVKCCSDFIVVPQRENDRA